MSTPVRPTPKISIITVCYNSMPLLAEAVESVAVQTYPNIEHIIIDGASLDNTREYLELESSKRKETGHPHRFRWASDRDKGIYDAMNKGIGLATGEIIGFLNSDDTLNSSDTISRYADTFNETNAEAVYADLTFVDRDNCQKIVRRWKSGTSMTFHSGWHPPHPTLYVKSAAIRKAGPFDLGMRISADYDLMLQLFECQKVKAEYLPQVTVRMRAGGISNASWKNIVRANLECLESWRKRTGRAAVHAIFLKLARKALQRLLS